MIVMNRRLVGCNDVGRPGDCDLFQIRFQHYYLVSSQTCTEQRLVTERPSCHQSRVMSRVMNVSWTGHTSTAASVAVTNRDYSIERISPAKFNFSFSCKCTKGCFRVHKDILICLRSSNSHRMKMIYRSPAADGWGNEAAGLCRSGLPGSGAAR